jgi:hypothetical protein
MGDAPTINEIKDTLYKLRDELTSLEEKIRKRRYREAYRQVNFIIDDLDKVIDMVEEYEAKQQ